MSIGHGTSLARDLLRLWGMVKPYRGAVLVASICATLGLGISLLMPLAVRAILNAAESPEGGRTLTISAFGLLALYVVRAFLSILGGTRIRIAGESLVHDLRVQLFSVLVRQPLPFFATTGVGSITTRLTSDVANVRSAATDTSISAVLQVLRLVGAGAIMVWMNWRLASVVLIVSPVAALAARYFGRKMRQLSTLTQERLAESNARATEALSAPRLVKAFGREGDETTRYATAVAAMRDQSITSGRWIVTFQAFVEVLFGASTITLFWYGGAQVMSGALRVGDLVAFLFYAQTVSSGISEVAASYTSLKGAQGSMDRVFEWLNLPPGLPEPRRFTPLPEIPRAIEFCDAGLTYPTGRSAVGEVSLRIEESEHVAVVGRSGGGKSSLLSLIPRLYDVSHGAIRIAGTDIRDVSLAALRTEVSYVSQDVQLMRGSIRENIAYGLPLRGPVGLSVEAAARIAQVESFAMELPDGLDAMVGENGVQLSGGQRQRIAIARALVRNAGILLLDEATSALDAETEERVLNAIRDACPLVTVVAVTHRWSVASQFPRVIVMEAGRVIDDDSPELLVLRDGDLIRAMAETADGLNVGEPLSTS